MQRALLRPCAGALRAATSNQVGVVAGRRAKNRGWYHRALARIDAEAAREAEPVFPQPPLHGKNRKRAFLDMTMGGEPAGRLVVELAVRGCFAKCGRCVCHERTVWVAGRYCAEDGDELPQRT